jgi:hypothetical protein
LGVLRKLGSGVDLRLSEVVIRSLMPRSKSCSEMRTFSAGTWVSSPLYLSDLSPTERLDEVARLLALGYLRLRARRAEQKANYPNHLRGFGLDFGAEGSVGDTDTHSDRERR